MNVVKVLRVSVIFCDHLQGGVLTKDMYGHKSDTCVGGLRRL